MLVLRWSQKVTKDLLYGVVAFKFEHRKNKYKYFFLPRAFGYAELSHLTSFPTRIRKFYLVYG